MTRGDYYELYDSNPSQNGRISFTCTYRLFLCGLSRIAVRPSGSQQVLIIEGHSINQVTVYLSEWTVVARMHHSTKRIGYSEQNRSEITCVDNFPRIVFLILIDKIQRRSHTTVSTVRPGL